MDTVIAHQHIQQGAEVLYMIPVYEEIMKEGKLVRKVRLVDNGKHHNKHGSTSEPVKNPAGVLAYEIERDRS
jgi:hypothetical protein